MSNTKAEVKSKEKPQSKPRRSKGDGALFKNSKGCDKILTMNTKGDC